MTRRVLRASAVLLCCGLLATACAAGDERSEDSARPKPGKRDLSLPAWKPATADVPRGKGSELPSDVNGDGHGDLVLPVTYEKKSRLTVVYGSRDGLDPAARTAVTGPGSRFSPSGTVRTGDLDGDGFADLVGLFSEAATDPATPGPSDPAAPGTPQPTIGQYIVWGGPEGPDPAADPTPLATAAEPDSITGQPGDFDGDGHTDLALTRDDRLEVRYGPFTRGGGAARTSTDWRVPSRLAGSDCCHDDIAELTAGDVNGDAATDLVVQPSGDGEQTAAVLLLGGAAGGRGGRFPAAEHRLPLGSATALGDFDGDGRGDIAVGDSGSRNNEAVDGSATPHDLAPIVVAYGSRERYGAPVTKTVRGSEALGLQLEAADLNGDGKDDLITKYGTDMDAILAKDLKGVVVLHGRDGGLSGTDRHSVRINGPKRYAGKTLKPYDRRIGIFTAGAFGGASAELVLTWSRKNVPARWWISRGDSGTEGITFSAGQIASG
ncbi:VCBS repeat-containing protein [Streptomyces sp. NBC_01381]|uniref:FG-GAP repeat domain-containing protein n=1 Tax=Streptomyces sp. NBC_01381 TaxID=2903845 RepID=UPI002256287A|nr:VCBS repeat-containing protein [Streptomyces sp. NBC_01381]MCX4667469.1 VCBS repeat-containing protein [Streptomyces sp. NBC_01381]